MRKTKILAASVAFGIMSGGSTAIAADSSVCGSLPNAKWSWSISYQTTTTGGGVSSDSSSEISYSNGGKSGNINGTETTSTTTTTEPTYEQTNVICTALNPQGKVNADHSTVVVGEAVMIDPGSSTTDTTSEKICGQGKDASGNPYPACPV